MRMREHAHFVGKQQMASNFHPFQKTSQDKLPNLANGTELTRIWRTHAILASLRMSRYSYPRDPALDSGSRGPRRAPSLPLTSFRLEYTTLVPDSLRAQLYTHVSKL